MFVPKKLSYISIPKINIYLFKYFYFFHFISTKFPDFASLKIQMQITYTKPFNVLNNSLVSVVYKNFDWFVLIDWFLIFWVLIFFPSVVHLTLIMLFFIMQKKVSHSNMHIESKNQNTKRRIETKNIPYFIFELKNSRMLILWGTLLLWVNIAATLAIQVLVVIFVEA